MAKSQYCYNIFYSLASFHITFALILVVTEALEFNYPQFTDTINTLNLTGDAYQGNRVIHLTQYTTDSFGRVTYKEPLHLWDSKTGKVTDFTTHFTFVINQPNRTYYGDGITFYLAQQNFPSPVPRDGSGIGILSRSQLTNNQNYTNEHPFVAVEFDTARNPNWDPPYDHVGIDVKSMGSADTIKWLSSKDERGYDADISYDSRSNNLSVTFTGYQDNVTRIQQHISSIVNLRDVLPEWVEFGFTSATGTLSYETHTLSSWSFNSTLQGLEEQNNDESRTGLVIGLCVGVPVLICVLGLVFLVRWRMRNREREDFDLAMDYDFERNVGPKRFSYEELARATDNFSEEHKIGEGGFGGVYKGFLRDLNLYVAIKRVSEGSRQGVKEYASEVKIISQLRHRNLVQLIGWSHRQNDMLLIYEFVENRSLDSYLFKGKGLLTWETRYNIAKGLASALLYLHEEWEQCVLHRDIKPSNIMLDTNFNAKLGDFGLARVMDHGTGSKTTTLAGTFGYLSPETATRAKTSKESDVYSFGIVALEIACGRRVIEDHVNEDQTFLVEWVWKLYSKGNLLKAADPRLSGEFDQQEMERLMIVGLWCSHMDYILRPTIRQAVQVLNFEAPMPTLPSQMPAPLYHMSFSSLLSSTSASGNNQTHPSTSINSSSTTTGSSQSNKTPELINPSSKLLHTL